MEKVNRILFIWFGEENPQRDLQMIPYVLAKQLIWLLSA